MKIAIATEDKKDQVSEVAGRAPYYLIFNESGNLLEEIPNSFMQESGGAGVAVAEMLAGKEITVVVAGDFGRKMMDALEDRRISYYQEKGSIKEVLEKIIQN